MCKVKANYYYAPICTEAFATLDRLTNFFSMISGKIEFFAVDISKNELSKLSTGGDIEKKYIESVNSNQLSLLYGRLFIDGVKIDGFPPSSKIIVDMLKKLNIDADFDLLKTYYNVPQNKRYDNFGEFKTENLSIENCIDECHICTKYSRYINNDNYSKIDWSKHENRKKEHLIQSVDDNSIIGFIEYMSEEPVGFIEGYSNKLASKYGFVVDDEKKSCMITCLHIREEVKGNGLSKKLIKKFIDESRKRGFKNIEVLAFPNDMNWQPIALYRKMNFKVKKKMGDLFLMSLKL